MIENSTLLPNRWLMLAPCFEQHRDGKRDDGAEANPPGKFHHRQPAWLRVQLTAEQASNIVRQTAQDRDNNEAYDHRDDVSQVVAASFSEHPTQENAEQRSVRVAEYPEHDWDDAYFRMHDDEVRRGRCDDNHQDREPDRGPADGAQALFLGCLWGDIRVRHTR